MLFNWCALRRHLLGNKSLYFVLVLLAAGCANQTCRQPLRDYKSGQKNEAKIPVTKEKQVYVYKYDGSVQCDSAKGITLEDMQKQLGEIEVYKSEKRSDGLMHLQVCGSRTGKANVFLISIDDLEEAKKRQFKVWDFK